MSSPIESFFEDTTEEIGHADSKEDLSTPNDDDQVEPGAEPWVEEDDDDGTESRSS